MSNLTHLNDLKGIIKALENEADISDPTLNSHQTLPLERDKEQAQWRDLKVRVEVVLGTTRLDIEKLSELKDGSIIVFEELADEFVDIYMNGVKVAKGKIATSDGNYAVQIVHILDKKDRIQTLY